VVWCFVAIDERLRYDLGRVRVEGDAPLAWVLCTIGKNEAALRHLLDGNFRVKA